MLHCAQCGGLGSHAFIKGVGGGFGHLLLRLRIPQNTRRVSQQTRAKQKGPCFCRVVAVFLLLERQMMSAKVKRSTKRQPR